MEHLAPVKVLDTSSDSDFDTCSETIVPSRSSDVRLASPPLSKEACSGEAPVSIEVPRRVSPRRQQSEESWQVQYNELVEFKRKFGHCNVPRRENRRLGNWVTRQRQRYKGNKNYG